MSAIAVQDPATKDIVFAYRGTDIDKNIWEAMKDIESDLAITSSGNVFVQDELNQFHDAYTVYTETIKKVGGGTHVGAKSFTGYSLGGGLDGLGHFSILVRRQNTSLHNFLEEE